MKIAVETGDVVDSTKLSATLFDRLDNVLNSELSSHEQLFNTSYQRYRGDAYQVTYFNPAFAVKCALMSRLRLQFDIYEKPVHLTQSISVGVQSPTNRMGDVYISSGRQLDKLSSKGLALAFESSQDFSLATLFLNDVLNHLTQKQSEILYLYIKHDFVEHHQIAKMLNTTRQNVSIHLARAKADLVKAFVETYQNATKES